MIRSAVFSPCGRYRYELRRTWNAALPVLVAIGLNPSRADAHVDDPTIRKEIGFATRWGFGGVIKVNMFGLISTDPKGIAPAVDPIGPENDATIDRVIAESNGWPLVAWGSHAAVRCARGEAMRRRFSGVAWCIGTTKDGNPRHTLRAGYVTPRETFVLRARPSP